MACTCILPFLVLALSVHDALQYLHTAFCSPRHTGACAAKYCLYCACGATTYASIPYIQWRLASAGEHVCFCFYSVSCLGLALTPGPSQDVRQTPVTLRPRKVQQPVRLGAAVARVPHDECVRTSGLGPLHACDFSYVILHPS